MRIYSKLLTLALVMGMVVPIMSLAQNNNLDSPEALEAYEQRVLTDPRDQAMSYGGGFEWTFQPEANCTVYVREYGDPKNETWIVLHGGWGAEHSYLLDAFIGLERDYHLLFYDQRGSLRSPCPIDQIDHEAHVSDLEALRVHLGLEKLNLAGHSMGGVLAMLYLERHPDTTGDLIFLSQSPIKGSLDDAEREASPNYAEWIESGQSTAFHQWMQRSGIEAEADAIGDDADALSAQDRQKLWRLRFSAHNLYDESRWPYFRWMRVFYRAEAGAESGRNALTPESNYVPMLNAHSNEVSFIIGDHDFADFGANAYRHWFGGDSPVHLTVLKNAGHNGWLDRPRAYRRALVEAMAR